MNIVKVYFNLIKNGRKTLEQVPPHLYKQVKEMVDKYLTSSEN